MIQKGIFAKTFNRSTVVEVLRAVREHGFELAQFNFACAGLPSMPSRIPESTLVDIRAAQQETGITFAGISGTFNMAHPDPSVRQEGLRRLEVMAAACPQINTRLITLCTGTRNAEDKWAHHPENDSAEAWRDMLQCMETALLIAERHNLHLGIEPEVANVVSSVDRAMQLLNELQTERLRIILDPANLFEKEAVPKIKQLTDSAIDRLAPHIGMAHAKDRDSKGNFVPPGKGVIPFDYFVERLQQAAVFCPLIAHGFEESEATFVSNYLDTILET